MPGLPKRHFIKHNHACMYGAHVVDGVYEVDSISPVL